MCQMLKQEPVGFFMWAVFRWVVVNDYDNDFHIIFSVTMIVTFLYPVTIFYNNCHIILGFANLRSSFPTLRNKASASETLRKEN